MRDALSFKARRIIAGVAVLPMMVVMANELGNYHWFWPYDRDARVAGLLTGVICVAILGPSLTQLAAYRRKKDYEARRKLEARLNEGRREA